MNSALLGMSAVTRTFPAAVRPDDESDWLLSSGDGHLFPPRSLTAVLTIELAADVDPLPDDDAVRVLLRSWPCDGDDPLPDFAAIVMSFDPRPGSSWSVSDWPALAVWPPP